MTLFYTTLTDIGFAALVNAQANNTAVQFTHLALGDGNGVPVTPKQADKALAREVYRVPISSVTQDPTNPNWLRVEAVVLATVGGWTVRELALIGDAGKFLAVGNFPETYKPKIEVDNASRDLTIRMVIEVSSASVVSLTVDPSVAVATNQSIVNAIAVHVAAVNPHPQYALLRDLTQHALAADPHPQYISADELAASLATLAAALTPNMAEIHYRAN